MLVTAHDAFRYFGRAYGLEVVGVQGTSTESEAGLNDINRLVELVVSRRIPAVFVETSVSDRNLMALREGAMAHSQKVKLGGRRRFIRRYCADPREMLSSLCCMSAGLVQLDFLGK